MTQSERLRPHPEERFLPPAQAFDLEQAARALRAEPHAAVEGHRQIAVFRRGPVTLLLFAFDADGVLKEHRTEGVVTIQALTGRLVVVVDEEAYDLTAGRLLALAPGIPHTVRALEPSDLLLTVYKAPDA
jgi:quercetin dioxygenase-like cupin family protein